MTHPDIIRTVLRDSNYHLSLFREDEIAELRAGIIVKTTKGKEAPFVRCIVRDKEVQLKPEEIVRQLYATRLITQYAYPAKRLGFEHAVNFGKEKKKADIVVFDKDRPDTAYIIVELKKPKLKDGKSQLRSYCNATGAPIGVWTNGEQISHYHRKDPNDFEDITDIPKVEQSLQDILSERFTLKDLVIRDKLANERKSLKDILSDDIAGAFIAWAKSGGLSFRRVEEEGLDNRRREAWQNIVDNNITRRLHVAPDIDISRLADEMNDMDMGLEV